MHVWACLAGISLALIGPSLLALTSDPSFPSPLHPSPSEGRGDGGEGGSAIESVRLEVFDLAGRRIFSSGPVPGATYKWYLQRDDGRPVANGVYLYIVFSRTSEGKEVVSSVGKIAVRR